MTERQTTPLTTPAEKKLVLNAYLTGTEAQQLKAILFSALKVNMEDAQTGKIGVGDVPSTFLVEQEKKAIEFLFVSYDGLYGTPGLDNLMAQAASEYEFLLKEINKIQNPTGPAK